MYTKPILNPTSLMTIASLPLMMLWASSRKVPAVDGKHIQELSSVSGLGNAWIRIKSRTESSLDAGH